MPTATLTKIADSIEPAIWNAYFRTKINEKNALVDSGIAVPDPELDILAGSGGTIVNMPYWNDIDGEDEVLADDTALTPGKITAGQDMARLHGRGKAWGANDLVKVIAGSDPMAAIADRVAAYWKRREQVFMLKTLEGVFGVAAMADHILDVSADDSTGDKVDGSIMIDAVTLLGDNADVLTAICIHSGVYKQMQKNNLIDFVEESDAKVRIPYYQGKRVLVDDNMPVASCASGGGKIYTSYLFGPGAIGKGEGYVPVPVEGDRDSLAGEDVLITRRAFLLHCRGIKWNEASVDGPFPTNDEVATAANWTRVYQPKDIRVVALKTNG